jgi:DNA-binding NarL/FixJ family response regulator
VVGHERDEVKREDAVRKVVLVVASPGYVLEGLQALLSVLSGVEVLVTTDRASALEIVERHAPALVIVVDGLQGDSALTTVTCVKSGWPAIRCIALVDDEQRREQAQAAGADPVLVKGIPADSLVATVEEMLFEEADL